ncbi:MAG: hypothetical protein C0501_25780 [Isosphaera sp.]|nr:hypothetical protein [Isosphaera sp.]
MAERRSLIAGVEGVGVDPETARAFIVQERPKPEPKPEAQVKPSPVRVVPEPVPQPTAEPVAQAAVQAAGEGTAPAASLPKPPVAKRADVQSGPPRLLATLLVPVTVRLRPEVASALKRASLERQLNGVETYTQQDIVEEALLPWLRAEGLLE